MANRIHGCLPYQHFPSNLLRQHKVNSFFISGLGVTPRDRCARCLPVIRCRCLIICLCGMHFISCHHVHRICIHVRLLHPSIFPVVHFAIQRSYVIRWPFLPSFRVWGLNISELDRYLPSGLGLLPVDRLSSFVPFGVCLILQRLTEEP